MVPGRGSVARIYDAGSGAVAAGDRLSSGAATPARTDSETRCEWTRLLNLSGSTVSVVETSHRHCVDVGGKMLSVSSTMAGIEVEVSLGRLFTDHMVDMVPFGERERTLIERTLAMKNRDTGPSSKYV